MTRAEIEQRYWRYYLLLESRFIDTIEYTEIHPDNYNAFSDNYAFIIQAIGAELDTMFKVYCGFNLDERKSINDYIKSIDYEECSDSSKHAVEHSFRNQIIRLDEYGIVIQPFENWDVSKPGKSLEWWDAFDKLKHNRYKSRKMANQKNCINLLGALCFIEMKMAKKVTEDSLEIDVFDRRSKLFTLPSWSNRIVNQKDAINVLADMIETKGEYVFPEVDV